MGDIMFSVITISLIVLFFVSLVLFFRRMLISQNNRAANNAKTEQKLDKIIELLERDRPN
ncbi:DUF4083 domain-containing protein [Sporosarcina sp. BI001-red]|uniref:DUF4083 domain-containing protein n=1 Tax=Sporosarcina sp. BI001-red TaxID=2282866 RepID=UPI00351A1DF8